MMKKLMFIPLIALSSFGATTNTLMVTSDGLIKSPTNFWTYNKATITNLVFANDPFVVNNFRANGSSITNLNVDTSYARLSQCYDFYAAHTAEVVGTATFDSVVNVSGHMNAYNGIGVVGSVAATTFSGTSADVASLTTPSASITNVQANIVTSTSATFNSMSTAALQVDGNANVDTLITANNARMTNLVISNLTAASYAITNNTTYNTNKFLSNNVVYWIPVTIAGNSNNYMIPVIKNN